MISSPGILFGSLPNWLQRLAVWTVLLRSGHGATADVGVDGRGCGDCPLRISHMYNYLRCMDIMYIYMRIHIKMDMHTYVYIYICMCTCWHPYVLYVCVYIYICVCVCDVIMKLIWTIQIILGNPFGHWVQLHFGLLVTSCLEIFCMGIWQYGVPQ